MRAFVPDTPPETEPMALNPPLSLDRSIEKFREQLKPPVGKKLQGGMILKVIYEGEIKEIRLNKGEVFMLPPHTRHSPQRPIPGSIGLVVESPRMAGMLDGFE